MQRTVEQLRAIRTFPALVEYLASELDWPIEDEDFEDLTFDYSPEELGLDLATAANIESIKQLRPLEGIQPWGIFFVEFEPKRLPVVALRRILGRLVVKKRASANSVERASWQPEDLLFISSFGEGDKRQISFAHFAEAAAKGKLPTLKVLGWDNLDTPLHLDAVAESLASNLTWPSDETSADAWREAWRAAFTVGHREVITTARDLSIRLAGLARAIRDRITTALSVETETGPLTKLMKAFQEALVHDLDGDSFADMYAQTIAYGLLSARIADPKRRTVGDLAGHMRTSPFLRELMEAFVDVGGRRGTGVGPDIDFDELGVSEVVELLDDANMEAVLRDFGDRNPQEDPVIHFYEHFLAAYDKQQKVQRGVFYTPRPVVSYIVRSVDELLRTEYGLADGLADTTTWGEMSGRHVDLKIPRGVSPEQTFVQILDPATGTGTFLVEVIDLIHKTMVGRWKAEGHDEKEIQALWNDYVPKHLLPRLHGFELLMAPYAIAHLKTGLKLYETGYRFGSDERVRVYLTNALEPASEKQLSFDFLPALAHEAQAVNRIKRSQRFTVVIGNPPYSGLSANMGPWIDGLLKGRLPDGTQTASYYHVDGEPLGERKLWLQDDYVKFIRLSQWLLDRTGSGIHGYITNHGYLDNPTFRGMRWSLRRSFGKIRALDLHGNLKKKEAAPDGRRDQNVFDIQQGVALGLYVKRTNAGSATDLCRVWHGEIWGDRESKYERLLEDSAGSVDWLEIDAAEPLYLFKPFNGSELGDYSKWMTISEIMPVNVTGIVTSRDAFVTDFEDGPIEDRVALFLDESSTDAEVKEQLRLSENYAWRVGEARRQLRDAGRYEGRFRDILWRPFDVRRILYHRSVVWRTREEVMRHMDGGHNLALLVSRQVVGEFRHVFISTLIANFNTIDTAGRFGAGPFFPVYLQTWLAGRGDPSERQPNFSPAYLKALAAALGRPIGQAGMPEGVTGDDIVRYMYAILHAPGYRERYAELLRVDFPRLPSSVSTGLFDDLTRLGGELVDLHLMVSPDLDGCIPTFVGEQTPRVGRVGWADGTVWLDAGKTDARQGHRATKPGTLGFSDVPEAVWDFHIGGYQVCHKWLKDRKGRTLSAEDIEHYQKIVVAISETIRLMGEIDEVIEEHGGWPDAFVVD